MQTEKKSLSTNLIYFFGALGGLLFGYDNQGKLWPLARFDVGLCW